MHELAICQALIEAVETIVRDNDADSVSDIHVSIGPLSGVESALLANAFPIAAAKTVAEAATLHLHEMAVKISCEQCGEETEVAANRLICGHCDNWRTQLVSGDELLLERVCMDSKSHEAIN
jgi:hydrogenase nickel incorporation protein HypA/HybF